VFKIRPGNFSARFQAASTKQTELEDAAVGVIQLEVAIWLNR